MVRRNPVQTLNRQTRRLPIREQRGSPKALPRILPAPVGGWNARDSLSSMKNTDAISMDNWFPRQSDVVTRPGYSLHCDTTEDDNNVEQLIPFENGTNKKLLACVNGKIIDVSTSTPSSLATGLSANDWSYAYMSSLVLMANGADVVKSYNGSTIASPAFTGVTLSDLTHVSVYGSRVYFVEKNSQSMWYGGVGAVAGALTEFDFSAVESIRGNLVFTSSLKGDGGDGGADDIFIAVFEGGDVMAYTGTNPGDATAWSKVGHYKIGKPIGRLSYVQGDDDLYIITYRGFEKLSELVKFGDVAPKRLLLSEKIQQEVSTDIKVAGENDGWRAAIYPRGQMMIFTVPKTADARRYMVRNINTGAWCAFKDFKAYSWAVMDGNCYFGGQDGIVYAFDDGSTSDNGATIRCDAQQAWTDLGAPGRQKVVNLIRPFTKGLVSPSLSVNVGSDFDIIPLASFSSSGELAGGIWDVAIWDEAVWGDEERTFQKWYGRNAIGEVIGMRLAVDVTQAPLSWNRTLMLVDVGGLV